MEAYLSKFSALREWPFPLAQQYFADSINKADMHQTMVLKRSDRFSVDGISSLISTTPLPPNSIIVKDGISLVTPGLMFLQFARDFDIFETILLGNLLCAKQKGPLSKQTLCKSDLSKYICNAIGYPGRKNAMRALKYMKDDACSIMEIFVDMFLGLPNFMGGLGLKGGVFNYEVILSSESAVAIGQDRCFIDYCFPSARIAYEYQGTDHNTSIDQDSSRMMALRRMGYNIITVTKSQLYIPEKLQQLLRYAAKTHKTKIRLRSKSYAESFQRIHTLLPRNLQFQIP